MDLNEWLEKHPAHRTPEGPWLTTIPEWPAIREAWRRGRISPTQVRFFLLDIGYLDTDATRGRVTGYLDTLKHERGVDA